jgi:hypothetical protein
METHALIYDRYLRYQMIAVVFRGEIAAREHQQLLECALARDAKRAQAILVSHIDGCVEDALRNDSAGVFRNLQKQVPVSNALKADSGSAENSAGKPVSGQKRKPPRGENKRKYR